MVKDTTNISYEVLDSKARFHEIEIEKQTDNTWQYSKDTFHAAGVGNKVGTLYEKFMKKIEAGKSINAISKIHTILCNSAYAAELWVNKVITEQMINSIEVGVTGAGRGMTALIVIPKQEVILGDKSVTLTIIIVDSFSHNNFELIDEDNKTLYW